MKLNKKEVSQNLRLFGYKRYGTMKKFAEAFFEKFKAIQLKEQQ